MRLPRSLLRFLAFSGMVTATVLGGNLAPSSAHVQTLASATYNGGHGSFQATASLNSFGCATYSNYSASLTFDHRVDTTVQPTDTAISPAVNLTVASSTNPSVPDYQWGEFVDGTYDAPNAQCPGSNSQHGPPQYGAQGNGGDTIEGFTGRLTSTGGMNCTLGSGTYTRGHFGPYIEDPDPHPNGYNHPELNIAFVFGTASGTGCPSTPVILKTTITHKDNTPAEALLLGPYTTECSSPIAPQSCNLTHQENSAAW